MMQSNSSYGHVHKEKAQSLQFLHCHPTPPPLVTRCRPQSQKRELTTPMNFPNKVKVAGHMQPPCPPMSSIVLCVLRLSMFTFGSVVLFWKMRRQLMITVLFVVSIQTYMDTYPQKYHSTMHKLIVDIVLLLTLLQTFETRCVFSFLDGCWVFRLLLFCYLGHLKCYICNKA